VNQTVPGRLVILIGSAVVLVGLLTGIFADFGAPLPWIIAVASFGLFVFLTTLPLRHRDLMVSEVLTIVLAAVIAVLTIWVLDLRDTNADLRADARAKALEAASGVRTFDFIVYAGEDDPDSSYYSLTCSSSSDCDYAYKRTLPEEDARIASEGGRVLVGSHVRVACRVKSFSTPTWYRLVDSNFMHGKVIELVPHAGQPQPPSCP
jgi:hypothetical protein